MNLSEVKLKLFEVRVTNIIIHDAYGRHIGNGRPEVGNREYKEKLYIAGESISQVSYFLDTHGLKPVSITEIDILLNAKEE